MSNPVIDVVEPSSNLDEQRAKISAVVTEYLPELLKRLVEAGVPPILISIVMASESGVYSNAITNRFLCPSESSDPIVKGLANFLREKITGLGTLTISLEPDAKAPPF